MAELEGPLLGGPLRWEGCPSPPSRPCYPFLSSNPRDTRDSEVSLLACHPYPPSHSVSRAEKRGCHLSVT